MVSDQSKPGEDHYPGFWSKPLNTPRAVSSLTARLIASHVFVILLAIGLVLLISTIFARRFESDLERERIRELTLPLTLAAEIIGRSDIESEDQTRRLESIDALAARLDVQILIIDSSATVIYDSDGADGGLQGDSLSSMVPALHDRSGLDSNPRRRSDVVILDVEELDIPVDGPWLMLTSAGDPQDGLAVGIVSTRERDPLLREYLSRILFAAGLSILAASVAGYLLSRKIAAPITRLTSAANAMAQGDLEQKVVGEGTDELGALVSSFNAMSSRVNETSNSQRDLLANVAHELRTPLTSIQGYAQALQDRVIDTPEGHEDALTTIRMESDRMSRLIQQLLELARLESGQFELPGDITSISQAIDRTIHRHRPTALEKEISLTGNADSRLKVSVSKHHLDQILSNLVSNALRHTDAGGVVTMSARSSLPTDADDEVTIEVSDSGEGVAPEEIDRLLKRFEKGPEGGFGLGLPIVQELVDLHGGTLHFDSEVGRGTRVTITLPSA